MGGTPMPRGTGIPPVGLQNIEMRPLMSVDIDPPPTTQRARQKRMIVVLAVALIIGGLAVLFLLKRMPLPMRMLVGLTDVIAGLVLLVVVRQKF
jgi:uncharacterized membrane protein HdeD (DUF308 family)